MDALGTIGAVLGPLFGAAALVITGWLAFRGKKGETSVAARTAQEAALSARLDDASEVAKYIREEVERQVAPIKTEIHELTNAVRARETQLWLWNMRGQAGDMPLLPAPILQRLGLAQLFGLPFEDTEPINKEKHP